MSDATYLQGTDQPSLTGTLTNKDGTPKNLSTASSVRLQMRLSGEFRYTVDEVASVVSAPAGTVRYDWAAGDLATAGDYIAHWLITYGDGTTEATIPENSITVLPA